MDKHVHEQWLQDYENWKESGMTLSSWAREHGIKVQYLSQQECCCQEYAGSGGRYRTRPIRRIIRNEFR